MEKIAGAAHWKQKELVVCSTLASCSKAGFCLGFFPMIEVSNMIINGIVPSVSVVDRTMAPLKMSMS